jgi:hypothetical protein
MQGASVPLTCQSAFASGNTLTADIATLAADDQAIDGQWTQAEATGDVNGTATPTAAQTKAANDLTAVETDLNAGSEAQGAIASAVNTLDSDIMRLTDNTPTQAESAVVHADISSLEQTCGGGGPP